MKDFGNEQLSFIYKEQITSCVSGINGTQPTAFTNELSCVENSGFGKNTDVICN